MFASASKLRQEVLGKGRSHRVDSGYKPPPYTY